MDKTSWTYNNNNGGIMYYILCSINFDSTLKKRMHALFHVISRDLLKFHRYKN